MLRTIVVSGVFVWMACSGAQTANDEPTAVAESTGAAVVRGRSPQGNPAVNERMWVLAEYVRQLDERVRGSTKRPIDQSAVVAVLDHITDIGEGLLTSKSTRSHPLIAQQMPRFLEEVLHARSQAAASDPDYVYAGTVVGACAACHDLRVCPFDAYSKCLEVPIY